jgi:hypothetical protein
MRRTARQPQIRRMVNLLRRAGVGALWSPGCEAGIVTGKFTAQLMIPVVGGCELSGDRDYPTRSPGENSDVLPKRSVAVAVM